MFLWLNVTFSFAMLQGENFVREKMTERLERIKELGKESGQTLSYSRSIIRGEAPAFKAETNNMEEWLYHSLEYSDYTYQKVGEKEFVVALKENASSINQSQTEQMQQTKTVRGRVYDANNEPLIGVNVVEKGTTNGTVTDMDGRFSLNVVPNSTLVFSYIGFAEQEIVWEGNSELKVVLSEDAELLDEVVVVGYGTLRKRDLTGAVGSVNSEELLNRPALTVEQSLAGKLAGVNVVTNSGKPGGRTSVSIRGFSSINATNDPLYIVDGIEWIDGISNLNPNDIESIDVLKDASSTAIYGTRGSNGVIIVTTKKGKKGGTVLKYDSYVSLNKLPSYRNLEVLTAREWLDLEEVRYKNANYYDPVGYVNGKYIDPVEKRKQYLVGNTFGNRELFRLDANGVLQPIYDINWSKEVFRTALSQSHNLTISGGGENANYALFLGLSDDKGIITESYARRYNARATLDSIIKSWLKVGGTLSYARQEDGGVDDSNGSYNVIRNIVEMVPFIPFKYADGVYGYGGDYDGLERLNNPLAEAYENQIINKRNTFNGSIYTNINLPSNIIFTSTLGANISNGISPRFNSSKLNGGTRINTANIHSDERVFLQWSNVLNYNKLFINSNLNAVMGSEIQSNNLLNWNAATRQLTDDYYRYFNLGAGSAPTAPSSNNTSYRMQSFFGRINYNLLEKYLFTISGRVDGSSRFGSNNKYAFFPSGSLAWRLSEEEFIRNVEAIDNLKLRIGYGITGNSAIGSYRSLANLANATYIFGNSRVSGISIGTLSNPNLKWEKTRQFNVGLDINLLNNRINLITDYFHKYTVDLLLDAPVPSTSGFTTVTKNIGNMRNIGVELTLNTRNIVKNSFSWETDFNFSWLKNRVTALGDNNEDIIYGFKDNQIIRVGESVGSIFGYIREGIYGTAQADEAAKYKLKPGDVKIKDVNNDGVINAKDRVIIGKGIPDFYGTLVNNFRYKNIFLILELQYQYGNQIFNNTRNSSEGRFGIANNYRTVLDSWTPENQDAVLEQIRPGGYSYYMDTRKLSDGSFIRGKNLMLGYNFNKNILDRLKISSLNVNFSVQNFFLITDYFGYDPELNNYNTAFSQGITYSNYPKPITYMFGLSFTL